MRIRKCRYKNVLGGFPSTAIRGNSLVKNGTVVASLGTRNFLLAVQLAAATGTRRGLQLFPQLGEELTISQYMLVTPWSCVGNNRRGVR